MTKIEDVPRPAVRQCEDLVDPGCNHGLRRKQGDGIQVPLHSSTRPDGTPSLIKRRTPVQADHVGASLTHDRQQRRRVHAK